MAIKKDHPSCTSLIYQSASLIASLEASVNEPYPCNVGLTETTIAVWHPRLDVILELGKVVNFLINVWEHSFPYNRNQIRSESGTIKMI